MQKFNQFINDVELADFSLKWGKFTWSNRRDRPIICRLDQFLASMDWIDKFGDKVEWLKGAAGSDHHEPDLSSDDVIIESAAIAYTKDFIRKQTKCTKIDFVHCLGL